MKLTDLGTNAIQLCFHFLQLWDIICVSLCNKYFHSICSKHNILYEIKNYPSDHYFGNKIFKFLYKNKHLNSFRFSGLTKLDWSGCDPEQDNGAAYFIKYLTKLQTFKYGGSHFYLTKTLPNKQKHITNLSLSTYDSEEHSWTNKAYFQDCDDLDRNDPGVISYGSSLPTEWNICAFLRTKIDQTCFHKLVKFDVERVTVTKEFITFLSKMVNLQEFGFEKLLYPRERDDSLNENFIVSCLSKLQKLTTISNAFGAFGMDDRVCTFHDIAANHYIFKTLLSLPNIVSIKMFVTLFDFDHYFTDKQISKYFDVPAKRIKKRLKRRTVYYDIKHSAYRMQRYFSGNNISRNLKTLTISLDDCNLQLMYRILHAIEQSIGKLDTLLIQTPYDERYAKQAATTELFFEPFVKQSLLVVSDNYIIELHLPTIFKAFCNVINNIFDCDDSIKPSIAHLAIKNLEFNPDKLLWDRIVPILSKQRMIVHQVCEHLKISLSGGDDVRIPTRPDMLGQAMECIESDFPDHEWFVSVKDAIDEFWASFERDEPKEMVEHPYWQRLVKSLKENGFEIDYNKHSSEIHLVSVREYVQVEVRDEV